MGDTVHPDNLPSAIAVNHRLLVHSLLYQNMSKIQLWNILIYFCKAFSALLIGD